jgi:hypothetical protein
VLTASNTGEYYVVCTNTNGCSSTSANIVVVNKPLPEVLLNNIQSLCTNDEPVLLEGTPAGGVYSGNGVNNNLFYPSVGAGQYDVTYTYTDNSGCSNSASVTVNVLPLPVLTFINLPDTVCSDVMSEQITLQAEPSGGTFSGPTVNGNTLTLDQFNTNYSVTYTYDNPKGCSNQITANVYFALCTGISSSEMSEMNVFPNPTKSVVFFEATSQLYTLELFNISGQKLISQQYSGNCLLDLSDYPSGLYFYRISNQSSVKTGKIELSK